MLEYLIQFNFKNVGEIKLGNKNFIWKILSERKYFKGII